MFISWSHINVLWHNNIVTILEDDEWQPLHSTSCRPSFTVTSYPFQTVPLIICVHFLYSHVHSVSRERPPRRTNVYFILQYSQHLHWLSYSETCTIRVSLPAILLGYSIIFIACAKIYPDGGMVLRWIVHAVASLSEGAKLRTLACIAGLITSKEKHHTKRLTSHRGVLLQVYWFK